MTGLKSNKVGDLYKWFKGQIKYPYVQREKNALADEIFFRFFKLRPDQRILESERRLPESDIVSLKRALNRLNKGEPLQYITGLADFLGHTIQVGPGVLIPRQETGELVLWVSEGIREYITESNPTLSILDFGTGSGCIAIALSAAFPGAEVRACDYCGEILKMAKHSALISGRDVEFFICNAFEGENNSILSSSVDFLVSNPPYVTESEKDMMQRNVVGFEPHKALFVSDADPLLFYRNIALKAMRWLKPGGWVYFEINEIMGRQCSDLLASQGYCRIMVKTDINGKERFIRAQRPELRKFSQEKS